MSIDRVYVLLMHYRESLGILPCARSDLVVLLSVRSTIQHLVGCTYGVWILASGVRDIQKMTIFYFSFSGTVFLQNCRSVVQLAS